MMSHEGVLLIMSNKSLRQSKMVGWISQLSFRDIAVYRLTGEVFDWRHVKDFLLDGLGVFLPLPQAGIKPA